MTFDWNAFVCCWCLTSTIVTGTISICSWMMDEKWQSLICMFLCVLFASLFAGLI